MPVGAVLGGLIAESLQGRPFVGEDAHDVDIVEPAVAVVGLAFGALVPEAEPLVRMYRPLVALEDVQEHAVQSQLAKGEVEHDAHGLAAVALVPFRALADTDTQLGHAVDRLDVMQGAEADGPAPLTQTDDEVPGGLALDLLQLVEPALLRERAATYGLGPGKMGEGYCYVLPHTRWVNLGFYAGVELDDPAGLPEGSGAKLRHVKVRSVEAADDDAIRGLLEAALTERRAALGR